jgi:uncharacterized membrane protein
MKQWIGILAAFCVCIGGSGLILQAQDGSGKDSLGTSQKMKSGALSFKKDIQPLISKKCMSCHYPENEFNSSQLVLATYEDMMKGGKHGPPVVPGNAKKSLLYQKLQPTPPFGEQMPDMKDQKLTPAQLQLVADWINQGAKK